MIRHRNSEVYWADFRLQDPFWKSLSGLRGEGCGQRPGGRVALQPFPRAGGRSPVQHGSPAPGPRAGQLSTPAGKVFSSAGAAKLKDVHVAGGECRDKAQRAERCGPARSSLSPQEAGPACDAWRGRGDVPGCSVRRERVSSRSRCPWCADGQRRLAPCGANGSLCSAPCVLPTSRRSPLCIHHSR